MTEIHGTEIASVGMDEVHWSSDFLDALGNPAVHTQGYPSGEYESRLVWPDGRVAHERDRLVIISSDSELPDYSKPPVIFNSEQAAQTVEAMCHWVQERGDSRSQTHRAFHFDSPCPYVAMASVLRGEPDPRESDKSDKWDKWSDTPKGDDTDSY